MKKTTMYHADFGAVELTTDFNEEVKIVLGLKCKPMALMIAVSLIFSALFTSCQRSYRAYEMLSDFLLLYGVDGTVFSSECSEDEDGYISDETFGKIFVFSGITPSHYALYLNSHPDFGSECGVFLSSDVDEKQRIIEACSERMSLISPGNEGLLITSDNVVFYSTLTNNVRAGECWRKIISEYT